MQNATHKTVRGIHTERGAHVSPVLFFSDTLQETLCAWKRSPKFVILILVIAFTRRLSKSGQIYEGP